MSMKFKQGFTVLELIIVITIIAILSSIAYPNYVSYVREAKRSDAHRALARLANLQEQWFSQFYSYTDDISNLGFTQSEDGHYALSVILGSKTNISNCASVTSDSNKNGEYTLIAIPINKQSNDFDCSCIFLNSHGLRSSAGNRTDPKDCW